MKPAASSLQSASAERLALILIAGQMLFFGTMQGLVTVAGYTLFLDRFGAPVLPYAYLLVALTLSGAFYGLNWLQTRWSIPRVLVSVLLLVVTILSLSWALLPFAPDVVALALIPVVTLVIQVGYIFPSTQMGRLFDVRQMKRLFPLVNGGVTIGFVTGSLGAPILVSRMGGLGSTLLAATLGTIVSFGLLLLTLRVFAEHFADMPVAASQSGERSSLFKLLKIPYVRLILGVQMLTTIVWQLLEYLYLAQAAQVFPEPEEVAAFLGSFGAIRNVVAIVVLLFLAGRLLNRFGLQLGLLIGPTGVGVGTALVALLLLFPIAPPIAVFWATVSTFGALVIFKGSFTIPSQKTAYQLLPAQERMATETLVEGIGMAAAVGLSGLFLIGLNSLPNLDLSVLTLITLGVVLGWAVISYNLYRRYGERLIRQLNRRILEAKDLASSEGITREFLISLLGSEDLGRIKLALGVFATRAETAPRSLIVELALNERPPIQEAALQWLEAEAAPDSLSGVEEVLARGGHSSATAAALRALAAIQGSDAIPRLNAEIDSPNLLVRRGALVALLLYTGEQGQAKAEEEMARLSENLDPEQRLLAAQVIGDAARPQYVHLLIPLLSDRSRAVRQEALRSAALVPEEELIPWLLLNLESRSTVRTLALKAVRNQGPAVFEYVESALRASNRNQETLLSEQGLSTAVRICGQIGGKEGLERLQRHWDHPDDGVREEILSTLNLAGFQVSEESRAQLERLILERLQQALYTLICRLELTEDEGNELLNEALSEAFVGRRREIFYLLSFLYEPRSMRKAESQIASASSPLRAFAEEMLDVTLSSDHKALLWPLIDARMNLRQRIAAMSRFVSVESLQPDERLHRLIEQPQIAPTTYVRSCALYAAGHLRIPGLADVIKRNSDSSDPLVAESARWALDRMDDRSSFQSNGGGDLSLTLERVSYLKRIDILTAASDIHLLKLAHRLKEVHVDEGETFIREGEDGDSLYLILKGLLRVHQGEEEILILDPGKTVGELAILDPSPRVASVTAIEPSHLFRIDRESFYEVLDEAPEIGRSVIRSLCQRVRMTSAVLYQK